MPSVQTLHEATSSHFYDVWATFPFLELPGEIRNKIYDLTIPRSHVLVIGSHPQREFQASQKHDLDPIRKIPRYRLSGHVLSLDTTDADPLGFLRTCRLINQEAVPVFYSKTTICFNNIKTIHKFLNIAPASGLQSVSKISLTISSYGEPRLTRDTKWKNKQDKRWEDTCARLARNMTNLRCLELDLRLATWPTQLSVNADWTTPLMKLKGDGLHSVHLTLRHYRFNQTRLGMAARQAADRMMTAEGREERDLDEALQAVREFEIKQAHKESLPIRARKVLVINDEDGAKAKFNKAEAKQVNNECHKASSKTYYRTKGLAGFHRVELSMVGVAWVGP
ncbi:uncharacterized protein HMPREF1541_06792 [Cyphellophora europaea CBS 101466]|uniref:DUF7730 domain-containing protein n=1 Tax=Cyphellophora europaea (strain CBS 101466) TaxID=1220924 RepID=W2RSQ1_CYPE1|nr:uncharacterized protein HMPREF1541_06792 [Cyphellophora europaea CBS 101466]ETN38754.1 hypothetical protein HMPREF1541_06792 [Cyphellophora europaea CBS 101466]